MIKTVNVCASSDKACRALNSNAVSRFKRLSGEVRLSSAVPMAPAHVPHDFISWPPAGLSKPSHRLQAGRATKTDQQKPHQLVARIGLSAGLWVGAQGAAIAADGSGNLAADSLAAVGDVFKANPILGPLLIFTLNSIVGVQSFNSRLDKQSQRGIETDKNVALTEASVRLGFAESDKKLALAEASTKSSIAERGFETDKKLELAATSTKLSIAELDKKLELVAINTKLSITELDKKLELVAISTKLSIAELDKKLELVATSAQLSIAELDKKLALAEASIKLDVAELDKKVTLLEQSSESRFEQIDGRFDQLDGKIDALVASINDKATQEKLISGEKKMIVVQRDVQEHDRAINAMKKIFASEGKPLTL